MLLQLPRFLVDLESTEDINRLWTFNCFSRQFVLFGDMQCETTVSPRAENSSISWAFAQNETKPSDANWAFYFLILTMSQSSAVTKMLSVCVLLTQRISQVILVHFAKLIWLFRTF